MSSLFPPNEHLVERIVRVVLGLGLLALMGVGPVPGWGLVGLIGLVPLATGALGSCPIYTLLGISTRGDADPGASTH
jgi:hypothetical protein